MHSKSLQVDKRVQLISSVNWDYTSFMENREAGVTVEGAAAAPILAFWTDTFNYDWSAGASWPVQSYTPAQVAQRDTSFPRTNSCVP
jgi:phosphatidylserine/phosphatidylglycerophosphate/cardiolipin synthase-like enzyme